jgi:hypothetical protein
MSKASLDFVKQQFDHWRAMHDKRRRIPEYLWEQVIPLLGHYTVRKILSSRWRLIQH